MSTNPIVAEGTLQPNGKLIFDKIPLIPPGRVRVSMEAIDNQACAGNDVIAVLQGIHASQSSRGHAGRTKEQIDAAIDAMRGEDESLKMLTSG